MTEHHEAITHQLRTRLDQLLHRVGALTADLRSAHDDDWAERATELENDDVLERLDDMTRREVIEIRQTLKNIKDGSYGICGVCRKEISPARLKAVPTASRCVARAPGV